MPRKKTYRLKAEAEVEAKAEAKQRTAKAVRLAALRSLDEMKIAG